ncbi:MAG: (R)-mandelonitrile lyase [Sporichthyaceae bacterium]
MDPYARNGGGTNRGPDTWFTGEVYFDNLVAGDATPGSIAMLKVRFAPGARTFWHAHPAGQALHVVDGLGRVAERDGPIRELRSGDSVHAKPMVWHWHGAGPDTFMTHIAVQIGDAHGVYTLWGDPVTDAEYQTG